LQSIEEFFDKTPEEPQKPKILEEGYLIFLIFLHLSTFRVLAQKRNGGQICPLPWMRGLTHQGPKNFFSPIRLQFSGRVQTVEQKFLDFEIIFFLCALSSFR